MFQNEIMIGASAAIERRVLSSITLGLAQDSGWYVPNWEAQGFLRHGHLVGCDMLVRISSVRVQLLCPCWLSLEAMHPASWSIERMCCIPFH
jgi:hypothetical protein